MRNEKKVAYQQEQIERMKKTIMALRQENLSLTNKCKSLMEINEKNTNAIHDMAEQHKKAMSEYSAILSETKHLKYELDKTLENSKRMEADYERKIKQLIDRIRKSVH